MSKDKTVGCDETSHVYNDTYNVLKELMLAVLMHMHLYSKPRFAKEAQDQQKARRSMLAIAVWGADKLDASRHPAEWLHPGDTSTDALPQSHIAAFK